MTDITMMLGGDACYCIIIYWYNYNTIMFVTHKFIVNANVLLKESAPFYDGFLSLTLINSF